MSRADAPDITSAGPVASVIRRRRMVRAFADLPVPDDVVVELIDLARRAPSAGNTQPVEFLVLSGDDVDAYWETTLGDRRSGFRTQSLLASPLLVVPCVRPAAYLERYSEPDKATTGLGREVDAWPVPYWWVDGGAAVQNLLLAAVELGLGACFFGQFEHETAVRDRFGVPDDRRALGTVAIGYPAPDTPGASAGRPRTVLDEVIHRGRW